MSLTQSLHFWLKFETPLLPEDALSKPEKMKAFGGIL